jgi:hypothetical protein
MFIPIMTFSIPDPWSRLKKGTGSWIRINPEKSYQDLGNVIQNVYFWFRISIFFHPVSRGKKKHRIRIRNTGQ